MGWWRVEPEPKKKASVRKLELLARAEQGGIWFHCVGGEAMHDPVVKALVRKGYLRFVRRVAGRDYGLSPKRFQGNFQRDFNHDENGRGHGIHGHTNRTVGIITPKGRDYLFNGRKA